MVKSCNSIIKEKGLTEISYQKDFLTNGRFLESKKPFVLAMGTSAGKTLTTIMMLEMFYRIKGNSKKKTLIIPSSTTILRDNFKKSLDKFNPTFSYLVIRNKKELIKAANADNCNVLVSLPQTLNKNIAQLNKTDIFILDEAHQWYFRNTITEILKKINPNKQLLLCGTPSKFVQYGNKFNFQFVPIEELYSEGVVTNAKIEIVSSTYSIENDEYQSIYGDLNKEKEFSKKEDKLALEFVCNEMINKISNKKQKVKDKFEVFKKLNKTIIFCHSIEQSDNFYSILKQNTDLKNKVLISHQISDENSENFIRFNNDKFIKILICVNRGRLGFSMNHLFNVVDFTLTKNIDTMLQIYGRLLRKSKFEADKIYFKVIPKNNEYYFINIMTAMLSLTQLEWYCKFNGKNMGGIRIPKLRNSYNKNSNISTVNNPNKSLEFDLQKFGLPIDLNLFDVISNENKNSNFQSVAYTTLDEVRKRLYPSKLHKWTTKEAILKESKKYQNRRAFCNGNQSAYGAAIRLGLLDEVCSHMISKIENWKEKDLRILAKKYDNKSKFRNENKKAYWKAKQLGILDEICAKMKQSKPKEFLTDNQILERAKKFKRRKVFADNDKTAYRMAQKRGILDKVCSHMPKNVNIK